MRCLPPHRLRLGPHLHPPATFYPAPPSPRPCPPRPRPPPPCPRPARYAALADASGLSLTELALKWCRSRPACTTVLLGHTSIAQLLESLEHFGADALVEYDNGLRQYLPAEVLWEIDRVHMRNRLPIFASTRVGPDWDGQGEIGEPIP